MIKAIGAGSVAALALLLSGPFAEIRAQDRSGTQGQQQQDQAGPLSEFDHGFVKDAYAGNMAEVALGQLAREKARDQQVRQLGEMLIRDHQSANEKIAPIATRHQVMLPAGPKDEARATEARLSRLSGAQFDREFAQVAVSEHRKTIDKYQQAAGRIENPQLRGYVDQTLPALREHLRMAQQVSRSLTPVASRSSRQESMSGEARGSGEPPNATALLNRLSADGYRVTSDFSRSGPEWIVNADRNGTQVTISYDPRTGDFQER